jgi:hypothetical protein
MLVAGAAEHQEGHDGTNSDYASHQDAAAAGMFRHVRVAVARRQAFLVQIRLAVLGIRHDAAPLH